MDWSNEKYVRLFTRDTPEWLCMTWQGRALWPLLLRKADRSGVIATKLGARGIAALVGLPQEVVDAGMAALLEDGCLIEHQLGFLLPNYLEAQETPQSDSHRQRESRERRRTVTGTTKCHAVSHDVTNGHAVSQSVTPDQSGPVRTVPEEIPPRAIPPSPTPAPVPDPRAVGDLAKAFWGEVSAARVSEAAKLRLEALPFPEISPAHQPKAFDELRKRIREEGKSAPTVCHHVLARLVEQARETKSVEWLSEKAFLEAPWRTAREAIPGAPRAGPRDRGPSRNRPPERKNPMRPIE